MTDTPRHIRDLQLKLWLAKEPGERLLQFLLDNENFLIGIREAKKELGVVEIQSPVAQPVTCNQ